MKSYLVGGAVRDRLLGLEQKDRDYVVVGALPEDLLRLGYRPIGKDFPVFLHPQTHCEYALARTERKSGRGYHGFVFHTDPSVTLEEDLERRDLTINAMAQDDEGNLVDPFGGARDLEAKILRHVSPAFAEDPVRLLRVARFAARFAHHGFRVAVETQALMQRMVQNGEVDHLVAERVFTETHKALMEPTPSAFLSVLREVGALKVLFPEVDALYGVPQPAQHHPEVDSGIHTEMVLDMAAQLAPGDALIAWCALTHDLGKALTPTEELPRHVGHEESGVAPITALSQRLKVPNEYQTMAVLCCRLHLKLHALDEMRPGSILKLLEQLDALRKPDRVRQFALVCEADHRGRRGYAGLGYPQTQELLRLFHCVLSVKTQPLLERGLSGPALGEALRNARLQAITQARGH